MTTPLRPLSLLRTAACSGLLLGLATTSLAAEPGSREERIQRYVGFCAAVRETVIDNGTCPHNPAQVAASLETDAAGLAEWVRTSIAYDPTLGSNRGAEGALAALAGGDWDRALLLAELLRASGLSPRFVSISRTQREIDSIATAWLKTENHWAKLAPETQPTTSAESPATALLAEHGLEPARLHELKARSAGVWKTVLAEANTPVETVAAKIAESLAKLPAAGASADSLATLREAMQTRVLVEIDGEDGASVLLSAGPDPAPPAPDAVSAAPRLDEIPEDQRTRFVLTVAMEPEDADPIALFTWAKDLSALSLLSPRLEIVPVNIAHDDPATTFDPALWRERLASLAQFQVVLRCGDDVLAGPVFARDGTILSTGSSREADVGNLGGGIGGLFGGGFGEEEETPAAPQSATPGVPALAPMSPTTGATVHPLSLTLEIREPGRQPARQKRLLTGALRPGLLPVYTADILATGGALGPLSVAWLALDATTANASALGEILTSTDPKRLEGHDNLKRFPNLLHDWQLGRLALAARELRAHPEFTLCSGPTVVMLSNQLRPEDGATEIQARVALDVVFDGLALVPRNAKDTAAAFSGNLRLGIASTLLETALLRRRVPSPTPRGTYDLWRAAEQARLAPVAVRFSTPAALGTIRPHALAQWGILGGETGRVLVFPGGPTPRTWWSIDPLDGRTIGRGEGAEGMSLMEYLQVIKLNLSNLKCNLAAMQGVLSGGDPDATGKDWLMCMTGADNPGSYVNWAGSAMEAYRITNWGGTLAQIGDCLAGAWDVYEMTKE